MIRYARHMTKVMLICFDCDEEPHLPSIAAIPDFRLYSFIRRAGRESKTWIVRLQELNGILIGFQAASKVYRIGESLSLL